jgi:predicted MFS family arabinose efflux permease
MPATPDIKWPRILLIYVLGVFAAMAVSQVVPVIGQIAGTFHPQQRSEVGLVVSLPSLVVALGALIVGWLVDRVGAKLVLLVGTLILIGGDFAAATAGNMQSLLIGRGIEGVGYVGVAVGAVAMISRCTSGTRRTWSLALWSSFVPMSFIVPFLASGWLLASGDWRMAFNAHAVVLVVLGILALIFLPSGALADAGGARAANVGSVLRSPWPYVLGISFGAAAFLQSGIVATLISFWSQRYGNVMAQAQLFSAIAMAVNIAGCLLVGRLVAHGVRVISIGIGGSVLAGAGALAMFVLPLGFYQSVAACWLFTFGCGLLVGMWILLPRVSPSPAAVGATSGLVTQLTLFGVLLGSPAAFAAEASGGPGGMVMYILGALAVGLIAVPVWMGRQAAAE